MLKLFPKRSINFYTCLFFIFSVIYAYARNCNHIFIGNLSCLIIGLSYHATYNVFLKYLDIIITNSSIFYYIIRCATWNYYYYLAVFITFLSGVIYMKYSFNKYHKNAMLWHGIIHFIGNIGIISITESCYINDYCKLCY